MMQSVVLHPAYVWDCDECGEENFERGIVADFSPEEMQEMRDEYGVEPGDKGYFMAMPENVTCKYCSSSFESIHQGLDECDT